MQTGSTATAGEELPAGLAQALYEQRSQSLVSEAVTVRLGASFPKLGDKLAETVGNATETLFLQSFDVDCYDLTARLSFGQPEHLSAEDMKSLLNGFRQRGSASTAVLREQKGAAEGNEPDAPGGIPPIASSEWAPGKLVKTVLKKTAANRSVPGIINLDSTAIPDGDTAQFRNLTYTDSNGVQQTVKVLSTAAATIPPGGSNSTTTEDVITNIVFAFDSGTHQLTATLTKKRLTVINKADISGTAPTAMLPLWKQDVDSASAYSTSTKKFTKVVMPSVRTDETAPSTTTDVFTATAHSNE